MNDEEISAKEETAGLLATLEECRETTLASAMHSLERGGDHAKEEHIRWLLDTAEATTVAANFLVRDSEYAGDMLNLCSYICDDCATSCEDLPDDENMVHCAQVCRNCASACREAVIGEEVEEEIDEMEEEEDESDEEKTK
jgi:hypothetical protein